MRLPGRSAGFAGGLALLICLLQAGPTHAHALGAQCLLDAIGQQAEQAVGLTTCDAEVGRSGGQPPRPYLHVVLTSQARQRVTGNVAGDEAARQEL